MNISDKEVFRYKDGTIVIDNANVFKGFLALAEEWGSHELQYGGGVEEIDEKLAKFADQIVNLRAKYEVEGDLLNGSSAVEVKYYDELNRLLDVFRTLIFRAMLDYLAEDEAIDLMLDLIRRGQ